MEDSQECCIDHTCKHMQLRLPLRDMLGCLVILVVSAAAQVLETVDSHTAVQTRHTTRILVLCSMIAMDLALVQ